MESFENHWLLRNIIAELSQTVGMHKTIHKTISNESFHSSHSSLGDNRKHSNPDGSNVGISGNRIIDILSNYTLLNPQDTQILAQLFLDCLVIINTQAEIQPFILPEGAHPALIPTKVQFLPEAYYVMGFQDNLAGFHFDFENFPQIKTEDQFNKCSVLFKV